MRLTAMFAIVLCAQASPLPAAPEGVAENPPASVAAMSQAEIDDLMKRVAPQVEKIRGLEFKTPVKVKIVDDETARKHMTERIERFMPRGRIRSMETAYRQIGLLPEGVDMMGLFLDVLEEQVGGYYDPEEKTFFVLDDMPRSTASILVAHELTHALDDQHFRIDRLTEAALDNNDASGAVGTVVEGSGTLVMTSFLMREIVAGRLSPEIMTEMAESDAGKAERLKAAPPLIQRSLVAPYVIGQTFLIREDLSRLMTGADPEDIDRVMRNPPASTEQVLHPDKYWNEEARDEPVPVSLPDLSGTLGEGWSLAGTDVLGELELAVLTGGGMPDLNLPTAVLPRQWTNDAASGWGGDRWQLYERGKETIATLATRWDSAGDAREFEAALQAAPGVHVAASGSSVVLVAGAGERAPAVAKLLLEASASSPVP